MSIISALTSFKPLYSPKSAAGTEHSTALLQHLWLWQVHPTPYIHLERNQSDDLGDLAIPPTNTL